MRCGGAQSTGRYRALIDVPGWSPLWGTVFSLRYFIVITTTTVGYGDMSPITTAGRIMTMLLGLGGLGLFMARPLGFD